VSTHLPITEIQNEKLSLGYHDADIFSIHQLSHIYRKLYATLGVGSAEGIRKILLEETFRVVFMIFCRHSDVAAQILEEAALSSALATEIRSFKETWIFGPDVAIHMPQNRWSGGVFHIDSCGNHSNELYNVLWQPLFHGEYDQLSVRINKKVYSLRVNAEQMLRFSATLEHKGNYNYTDKHHCSVVFRVTHQSGLHHGPNLMLKRGQIVALNHSRNIIDMKKMKCISGVIYSILRDTIIDNGIPTLDGIKKYELPGLEFGDIAWYIDILTNWEGRLVDLGFACDSVSVAKRKLLQIV